MDMKEVAAKYADYQVEMRRWFHHNPELSEKEFETAAKIREELDKIAFGNFQRIVKECIG